MDSSTLQKSIAAWHSQEIKLLAVAGRRRTGKDIAQDFLKKRFSHIPHYRIADAPAEIARILKIEPSREVYHALFGLNKLLYDILGESAFKRRVSVMLKEAKPPVALVAAIRTEEEFQEFVTRWGGVLIGLCASPETRYERAKLSARANEKGDEAGLSFKEFMGDPEKGTGEYHPIEREIDSIVARAHFIIENNFDTPGLFHIEIEKVMSHLGLQEA